MEPPPPPPHTRRRVLRAAAALGLGLLLAELLLQAVSLAVPPVARALGAAPPVAQVVADPVYGVRGNPAAPGHDARGFRNPEALHRASVVAVGDSQTYGAFCDTGEAWPAVLGATLGEPVYSMAVPGYGPPDYLDLIVEALPLRPRTVVVAVFTGNDIFRTYSAVREGGRHGMLAPESWDPALAAEANGRLGDPEEIWRADVERTTRPAGGALLPLRRALSRHCRLYGLARAARALLRGGGSGGGGETFASARARIEGVDAVTGLAVEVAGRGTILRIGIRRACLRTDDPRVREGARLTAVLLSEAARRAAAGGARLAVVLLPTKETVWRGARAATGADPPEWEALRRDEESLLAGLRAALEGDSIPVLDLLEPLRAAVRAGEPVFFENADDHLAPAGQRLVGGLVAGMEGVRRAPR